MKKSEREHLNKIASMPCSLCGDSPVEVHHLREGKGMAQRSSHFLTIPLCVSCHRGDKGLHGDRTMFHIYKKDELDLLAETIEALYQ